MQIGQCYQHPEDGIIYVTSGQYMGAYERISNHWSWKKVGSKGELSEKTYHGYGGKWLLIPSKVIVKVTVLKV